MGDKLDKEQRIYLRNALYRKQGGICHFCNEKIVDLRPGVYLADNWRRAVLVESDHRWRLGCQPCVTAINNGSVPLSDEEKAELDQMIEG